MSFRVEDVSAVEKKLHVEVPWETVLTKLGEAYRELSKGVALKGFRKGKVPRSVLERMFGRQVRGEVANQLVRENFLAAAQEHHLHPVTEPRVEEVKMEDGQPFTFSAHIEVRQHLHLEPDAYAGLELQRRTVTVGEEAVDRALEQVRREQTELRPIEDREVTAAGDIIAIAIKGSVGDIEVDRPQITIDLDDREHEPLPGLAAALTGIPIKAADHEVTVEVPADHSNEEVAGKTGKFTVSVVDARRKDVPELDDELAKDTGRAQSLAELRQVLRADLEKRAADEVQGALRESALKALVKRHPIPVAPALIERAAEGQLERIKQMFSMQGGGDPSELFGPEVREKLREGAADEVRGQLLLEAVVEQEKVEVGEAEIDAAVQNLARMRNTRASKLRAEMERDGKLESVAFRLRQEKVLDLLVSRATITDAPAAPAEHEHSHEHGHEHSHEHEHEHEATDEQAP